MFTSSIVDDIKGKQVRGEELQMIKEGMHEGQHKDFGVDEQAVLYLGTKLCVPTLMSYSVSDCFILLE